MPGRTDSTPDYENPRRADEKPHRVSRATIVGCAQATDRFRTLVRLAAIAAAKEHTVAAGHPAAAAATVAVVRRSFAGSRVGRGGDTTGYQVHRRQRPTIIVSFFSCTRLRQRRTGYYVHVYYYILTYGWAVKLDRSARSRRYATTER